MSHVPTYLRAGLLVLPVFIIATFLLFPALQPNITHVNALACGEYCEGKAECSAMLDVNAPVRVPAQPVNTWTNLAFLIAGVLVFRKRKSTAALWFAIAMLILGVGSATFHAFLSVAGQRWDVIGMFLVFGFLAAYAIFATLDMKYHVVAAVLAAAARVLVTFFFVGLSTTLVIGVASVFILFHLVVAFANGKIDGRPILGAIAPFAVAFLFRQLDVLGIFCAPTSLYQGHGVWHVLAAIGLFRIFGLLETLHATEAPATPTYA
jgi:hypothetical protein